MTSVEFLATNGYTPEKRESVGFVLGLQAKIEKHLLTQDDLRVRDYLIAVRILWPILHQCPVERTLLSRVAIFLTTRGWVLHLTEDHSSRISQYITHS